MCGIVGITAETEIGSVLLKSLHHLEYRGYDSCGMATLHKGKLTVRKQIGDVTSVAESENLAQLKGQMGIAHTRWATNGGISQANAHPHLSYDNRLALVHNGIIHNYTQLKEQLLKQGVSFKSQTDTEVIVNLLAFNCQQDQIPEALLKTCGQLDGSFSFCFIQAEQSQIIYCVRRGAPLVIGLGSNKNCVASDIHAMLPVTRTALVMEDGEYALLTPQQVQLRSLKTNTAISRKPFQIQWNIETTRKGGHAHYMLKEIFEQPETLKKALVVAPDALLEIAEKMVKAKRIFLVGVGTTYYVALLGQYLFTRLSGLSATAVNSDEFSHMIAPQKQDLILGISQSGETYDTRQAILAAKKAGADTAAIVNMMGSSLSMDANLVALQGSGPEICVVSTKAALAQIFMLLRLTASVGLRTKNLSEKAYQLLLKQMQEFPEQVGITLNEYSGAIRALAEKVVSYPNWLVLGRSLHYPAALETALKLKEITYLHIEGMPSGFLKHGALAMVDKHMLSCFLLPPPTETYYNHSLSAVEEVRARQGYCIGFYHQGDKRADSLLHQGISLPKVPPLLSPMLQMIMGQLLAYFTALKLDRSIDKPRNLAKSVTVS